MIWEIIILALAFPVGYLIAWLGSDELKDGKKWFRVLIIGSLLLGLWFYLTGSVMESWTMGFVFVVSLVSFVKSGK